MTTSAAARADVRKGRRGLAVVALLAAAAAAVVPLAAAGVRGLVGVLLVGVAGLGLALVGVWLFLAHRGALRWVGAAVGVAGPVAALVVYARHDLVWVVVVTVVLAGVAAAAGEAALVAPGDAGHEAETAPPPQRPVLIMNPRSGGGKVGRFDLVARARALGAEVVLLDRPGLDAVEVAREAVANGADLLGVAGGDGTQALVAGVAAEHDLPFLVISAGTRNHFARDLGLDLANPARCLDALTDGVEVRMDLGDVAGRPFVNNASFGAYATVVRSPEYREAKARTTLDLLPDALAPEAPTMSVTVDGEPIQPPQAVLVSNNPYDWADISRPGSRPRLDGGELGVLAVRVQGAAGAASMVRGLRSRSVYRSTASEVVVAGQEGVLAAGVDGEALALPSPVRCTIRPGVLRVRVPRKRQTRAARPAFDARRLVDLAVGRSEARRAPDGGE